MLDTNLCIRVLRDRPRHVGARFTEEADGLGISTVVLTELVHGAAKSPKPVENRLAVDDFVSRLEVLPFDEEASRHAGEIKAVLERRGEMIGVYDLLIAGHARSRGLALVTGNLKEFRRVDGLMSVDWT